jgi:hypothetical protein
VKKKFGSKCLRVEKEYQNLCLNMSSILEKAIFEQEPEVKAFVNDIVTG